MVLGKRWCRALRTLGPPSRTALKRHAPSWIELTGAWKVGSLFPHKPIPCYVAGPRATR